MTEITVREALRDAMAEEMRRDERVLDGRGSRRSTRAPTKSAKGCSKNSATSAVSIRRSPNMALPASALARPIGGLRPIVEFMTFNFAMQAIDHIINSAAKTLYMSGGADAGARSSFAGPTARPPGSPRSTPRTSLVVRQRARASRSSRRIRRPTPRACSRPRSAIPTR